jgi:hypothetical protein
VELQTGDQMLLGVGGSRFSLPDKKVRQDVRALFAELTGLFDAGTSTSQGPWLLWRSILSFVMY